MIKLRIDVDYPYPSRLKSFIFVASGLKLSSNYLTNAKILARMINESTENVKAYWFFTPKTIPDGQLLTLLDCDKHEVAIHIVNNPEKELKHLEERTGRKVAYYTIHGTARIAARVIWKRWRRKEPRIPEGFPLKSLHDYETYGLDTLSYNHGTEEVVEIAQNYITKGCFLQLHPIWLFQRGKYNHRGPFYEALRRILEVDKELATLTRRKKAFFTIANDSREYEKDIIPTDQFIQKLKSREVDVFTFVERKWCRTISNLPNSWSRANDNIAILETPNYEQWLKDIGKKTRNMIRKAEKSGIVTAVAEPDEKFAEGIWKIYNETPIRQDRGFPHYGVALEIVKKDVFSMRNSTYIGAYLNDELAGFITLVHGDQMAIISQILSLQKHWDKAVNNALVAKTVEFCAGQNIPWIMYGRMGNHPSLDSFKQNNGFSRFELTRYYIPITRKGIIATKLGLHEQLKDRLPQSVKYRLIPVYNWISRTKTRLMLQLRPKQIIQPESDF